jgi:hypothetical protein
MMIAQYAEKRHAVSVGCVIARAPILSVDQRRHKAGSCVCSVARSPVAVHLIAGTHVRAESRTKHALKESPVQSPVNAAVKNRNTHSDQFTSMLRTIRLNVEEDLFGMSAAGVAQNS